MENNVFGKSLKKCRTEAGLTQKSLAESLGISPASVMAYEKGNKTPSLDVAAKIAGFFGVTLDSMSGMAEIAQKPETWGDVARALCKLLGTGLFELSFKEERNFYTPPELEETFIYAIITTNQPYNEPPEPTRLDLFLENYGKMERLLNDHTLSEDIFNTWLESELSKLDKAALYKSSQPVIEGGSVSNAETKDNP